MIHKRQRYGSLFIIPFFIIFITFTLIPLVFTFLISFTNFDRFSWEFIGIANYINVLKDQNFWHAFANTWMIWLVTFAIQLTLAMLLATLLNDVRLRMKTVGIFRTIFFLPNLMATASVAVLFSMLLGSTDTSILNSLLLNLHIIDTPIKFLENPLSARLSVSGINAWIWYGNTLILIMAGMTSVPKTIYESAWIDGASRWQVYKDITLPSIKPTLTYVLVTSLIGGMQSFDIAYLLPPVQGGPDGSLTTMAVYLYQNGFTWLKVGYAGALSIIMFILISIFANGIRYMMRER